MTAFQELLERRRNELRLTWQELAKRSGLSYGTCRRLILEQTGMIKEEQVHALARGLKFDADWLKKAVIQLHLGWDVFEEQTEEDAILIAGIKRLDPEVRRGIVAMVEELRREESE